MTTKQESPDVSNLIRIQENFADYQRRAFPERVPSFFALELAGECGELANCEKKIWRDPNHKLKENELEYEAADVFIALINYCNARKINLELALKNKLQIVEEKRQAGLLGKTK